MEILYLDCFSGVSGDMMIGALLDSGADWEVLQEGIDSLAIGACIEVSKQVRQGISCSSFRVHTDAAPQRNLASISTILLASPLPTTVKTKSMRVFQKLAAAEAAVHGVQIDEVHFHELGAVDTIVDIVGTFLCLESMGIEKVYASSLPWTQGLVDISHGRYPVPAPATALLLQGYPCHPVSIQLELVTPTGAALLTSVSSPRGEMPPFIPVKVGYGAGVLVRDDGVPNLLRAVRAATADQDHKLDTVAILETEVDDLNPEIFSYLHHVFTEHPAVLDYFTAAIQMKKNRPGTLITLLTYPHAAEELSRLIIRETGSLGVRFRRQERFLTPRREEVLTTPWGPVRIKISRTASGEVHVKPEYEDCARIARQEHFSLLSVYARVNELLAISDYRSE